MFGTGINSTVRGGRPEARGGEGLSGVLLVNLGTPDAPTAEAVRRYLREFLWDRRVVNVPRPVWWVILNVWVLRLRPRVVARRYAAIWTKDGPPLLAGSRRLAAKVSEAIEAALPGRFRVVLAMRYGRPSVGEALAGMLSAGIERLIVLPLYPQYASATTASVFDAVAEALRGEIRLPELSFIRGYHDDPAYVAAVAESVKNCRKKFRPDKTVFSFHGLPRSQLAAGDPYFYQCHATARLVAESAGLGAESWTVAFQSRFGSDRWLAPALVDALDDLAERGARRVAVLCPGFAVDCLETLEEVAIRARARFRAAGGDDLIYIPALNDGSAHVKAIAGLIQTQFPA